MEELALCDSMLGKPTPAVALMRQARSLAPADPEIMFRTAEIYEQGGNHGSALDWLDRRRGQATLSPTSSNDPTFQGIRDDPRYKQIVQDPPAQPPAK